MKEIWGTITSKGQVTIPAEVRRQMKLDKGDHIIFVLRPDGGIELKRPRYPNIASLAGAAGKLKEPRTWHEMRDLARQERWEDKLRRSE